jgi:hypothetical protein
MYIDSSLFVCAAAAAAAVQATSTGRTSMVPGRAVAGMATGTTCLMPTVRRIFVALLVTSAVL